VDRNSLVGSVGTIISHLGIRKFLQKKWEITAQLIASNEYVELLLMPSEGT